MAGEFAVVILAGGRGSRLGGVDKAAVRVGGRALLDRTLEAVSAGDPVVVVGPPRAADREVVWTREDPPGAGPLAGLAAGLRKVPAAADLVAVLAVDHPYLTSATLRRLADAVVTEPRSAGAVLIDADGAPQWLLGVWRVDVLRTEMPAEASGGSVRSVLGPLKPAFVSGKGAEASDVDTPEDLRKAADES